MKIKKQKGLIITESDLKNILDNDYQDFKNKIVANVRCGNCSKDYSTTIADYSIEINDLNDLILRGKCIKCGVKVARYVETGENSQYLLIIEKIKKRN